MLLWFLSFAGFWRWIPPYIGTWMPGGWFRTWFVWFVADFAIYNHISFGIYNHISFGNIALMEVLKCTYTMCKLSINSLKKLNQFVRDKRKTKRTQSKHQFWLLKTFYDLLSDFQPLKSFSAKENLTGWLCGWLTEEGRIFKTWNDFCQRHMLCLWKPGWNDG